MTAAFMQRSSRRAECLRHADCKATAALRCHLKAAWAMYRRHAACNDPRAVKTGFRAKAQRRASSTAAAAVWQGQQRGIEYSLCMHVGLSVAYDAEQRGSSSPAIQQQNFYLYANDSLQCVTVLRLYSVPSPSTLNADRCCMLLRQSKANHKASEAPLHQDCSLVLCVQPVGLQAPPSGLQVLSRLVSGVQSHVTGQRGSQRQGFLHCMILFVSTHQDHMGSHPDPRVDGSPVCILQPRASKQISCWPAIA